MTAAVWQSREALEERIGPDFVEIGSSGALDRESLIALILGSDPGVWAAEDFAVRELAPTVALARYRSVIDQENGEPPRVALRSSIWRVGGLII